MSGDWLIVSPHPDDAELGVGGLIAKLTAQGQRVVLLDLSRGERSTRGTVEQRQVEARAAAKVLGVTLRENAELPDGGLQDTAEQRLRVAHFIRKHRPTVLLAPRGPDRHPDHTAAYALCAAANFEAGLEKLPDKHPPHRASRMFYYYPYTDSAEVPPLVVDASEWFEMKLNALRQYRSQFHHPGYGGAETMIATKAFWDNITTRAAYWGARIGVEFGEPLFTPLPLNPEKILGP
jgi:N-acetylglucosamine malate deacetylase 1